jgi:hypothetical protein
MVPMDTDILLIGDPDKASATKWSSTQNNYLNLWLQQTPDQPAPFGLGSCPDVGAHLMWTLPYSLRQGNQPDQDNPDGKIDFYFAPNRWLITRFYYATSIDPSKPVIPVVTAIIVKSDELYDISASGDSSVPQYPYPADPNYPVRGIGSQIALAQWDGQAKQGTAFLTAVGPGDISWSVAYDNVKNVFSIYDPLDLAVGYYTYSLIGWYDNPEDDALISIPTTDNKAWQSAVESKFQWSVGQGSADVQEAVDAWLAWQQSHGLIGQWDPSKIVLPPQMKDAIVAWHTWQQANGETDSQPPLPKQTVCHSMVSVQWQGRQISYGTGVPKNKEGEQLYPSVAVGNSAIEAISTYMANRVVSELRQSPSCIPVIERALEAFQKDLLAELGDDPVKVETILHNARFQQTYAGQVWIVVRPESSSGDIAVTGGEQTIPLNLQDTRALTTLNTSQDQLNSLGAIINAQQQELFLLSVKQNYIDRNTPQAIKDKVAQSIQAIESAIKQNSTSYTSLSDQIRKEAADLTLSLGTHYVLKAVDILPSATPNDPVIMIGGSQLDSKLSPLSVYYDESLLFVRFTGQSVTGIQVSYTMGGESKTFTIDASQLLGKVSMPAWNAIPKEAMDLWVELLLLDTSCASLIAALYFNMRGVTPSANDMIALTAQVKAQQTSVWNSGEELGFHQQALKAVSGFVGVLPAAVGVAFVTQQPWTPIYMDWRVIWYPSSADPASALKDWKLGDIDYEWIGSNINPTGIGLQLEGRTILNARTAQNIQLKFETFKDLPDYDNLPEFVITDLAVVANEIGSLDMLTQGMNGFTKQLVTQLMSMNSYPTDQTMVTLLGNSDTDYRPVLNNYSSSDPFFPIRSGHFSLIDLWIVDAYGQIMRGKDGSLGPAAPIPGVSWAESLETSSPNYQGDSNYGQLPPRLQQPTLLTANLLQADDDSINTNSSDLTSPICGWVMPNHLDNSLMVFDQEGNLLGSVLKVQREIADATDKDLIDQQYTIRWDNAPGTNTALGAKPALPNAHLQSFVDGLLLTGFSGAGAYDDLLSVIDVTLWPVSPFNNQNGNQSIMIGRPLAVVRASIDLSLAGEPVYNQSWIDTGAYYNKDGAYDPVNPPFMNVPFTARIGDAYLNQNGVIGYFQADDYSTFYAVYGANGQTSGLVKSLRGSKGSDKYLNTLANDIEGSLGFETSYVQTDHLVSLPATAIGVKLTMLMDPGGVATFIPGSLPAFDLALPTGPVSKALNQMKVSFRAGPLLLDPLKIQMPTPAEIQGKWGWMARRDITSWSDEQKVNPYTPVATLSPDNLSLSEGYIMFAGTEQKNI